MKISQENRQEIQWFVYYLFKGSLDPELVKNHTDYVQDLIQYPEKLNNCFQLFASCKTIGKSYKESTKTVAEYIATERIEQEWELSLFWSEFVNISKLFCTGSFEIPVKSFNLNDLDCCGADAVPFFAVWTNNIEIDEAGNCLNKKSALKRANERLLLWDSSELVNSFNKTELEQEIY